MTKAADTLLVIVLTGFALIQLNDPDPLFWFSLYVICALGPLVTLIRPFNDPLFWMSVGFCLAGLALSLTGGAEYLGHVSEEPLMQDMTADKPFIEQAREFLGSLISLALIGAHRYLHRTRQKG